MTPIEMTIAILVVLILVRNQVVYRQRLRRLDVMRAHNLIVMERGQEHRLWDYDEAMVNPYILQLLDLTKWTYNQFFPEKP